jgi:hypothetical protein
LIKAIDHRSNNLQGFSAPPKLRDCKLYRHSWRLAKSWLIGTVRKFIYVIIFAGEINVGAFLDLGDLDEHAPAQELVCALAAFQGLRADPTHLTSGECLQRFHRENSACSSPQ